MQARLILDSEEKRDRAYRMRITNPDRKYEITDLAAGDVLLAATGVTDGSLLDGVKFKKNAIETSIIVVRSWSKTVRWIKAEHAR